MNNFEVLQLSECVQFCAGGRYQVGVTQWDGSLYCRRHCRLVFVHVTVSKCGDADVEQVWWQIAAGVFWFC